MKIASELSNLVVYCQAVQFNPDSRFDVAVSSAQPTSSVLGIPGHYFEMISFSDSKIDKYIERGTPRRSANVHWPLTRCFVFVRFESVQPAPAVTRLPERQPVHVGQLRPAAHVVRRHADGGAQLPV